MHFPQFCQDRYPPRWLYREYLDFIRDMTIYMAADSNVALNFVTAEVNAIAPLEAGYRLTTTCGSAEQMNALVLCSGHNPPECLYPVDGVIAYQAHQDLPPINPYSSIGVIGCSLTAIDAIVELMERLGATDICALSRSGLFPSVQPALMRPPPEAFAEALRRFVAGRDFIDAHQLVHAINAALARHYPGPERLTVLSALGKGAIAIAIWQTVSIARVLPGSISAAIWRRSTRRCAPPGSRWMPTTGRSSCAFTTPPGCAIDMPCR